jgi:pimeloyl-ACP methyl ester carboxylesterase
MKSIILLHGALGFSAQLENLRDALHQEGFSVYSLNFSGHGGQPFEEQFGIEKFAEQLSDFWIRHQPESLHIFGYSMGGYVALWFASKFPDRVKTIVTLGTKFDWTPESAQRETKRLNPEKLLEKVPDFARTLEQRHAPVDWKELLHRTSGMMIGLGANPLLTEQVLSSIKVKTLIAVGDKDEMVDRNHSEFVASVLPSGEFRILGDTPHPIEKVSTEKLKNLITGFIG